MAVLKYKYSELLSFARDCLETGAFCDVAFHCGGGGGDAVVRCHGLILSAVLPHFGNLSALLRDNDGGELDVYMPDFDALTLRAWIGMIYDGLVNGSESVRVDVPPGFAGAFGLFSAEPPAEEIKAEPDTEQLVKGQFCDSENGGGGATSSEEVEEAPDDLYFHEDDDDDDYGPAAEQPKKRRRKRPGKNARDAPKAKKGRPTLPPPSTSAQSKQRMDYNVPRFVKEPPYEDVYSSFEEDDQPADEGSERRRKRAPPSYDKAAVRDLFGRERPAALERVLFRFQAAGTIPDMYERAYFTSIGAVAYEDARKTVRFRPITTSDSTMLDNSREFDEFALMLRSCYGLSTSDVFFQPYSPYRKLLYLPWRDQLRDAARRIKSVYGDDKELIEAAKVEHQAEMQHILCDNAPMPTRPKYSVGYHKVE